MSGPFAATIKELCGQRFRKCCRIAAEMDRVSQDSNNCSVNEPEMDDTNRRSEKDPTFGRRIIEEFKNSSNN